MKEKFSRIARILISIVIILISISFFGIVLNHPNGVIENTVKRFYKEEKNSLDYVFMGSSAAQCDICPPVIWNESNLTGYCFSVTAANSDIYLSMLKEIVEYQPNAVIFVDMDGFDSYIDDYNAKSMWIDSMNRNKNWFDTINKVDSENRLEHYFPILKCHKDIYDFKDSLQKTIARSFSDITDYSKGSVLINEKRLNDEEMDNLVVLENNKTKEIELDENSTNILIEFCDYCKDNKIKVIFCDLPKAYCDKEKYNDIQQYEGKYEYCRKIIEKYGFNLINFNSMDNVCEFTKEDFADSYHLNQQGTMKLSSYIGNYLKDKYTFNVKDEDIINKWNEDYNIFIDELN